MSTILLVILLSQFQSYQLPPYTGQENNSTWQWEQYQRQQEFNREQQDRTWRMLNDFETQRLLRENNIDCSSSSRYDSWGRRK